MALTIELVNQSHFPKLDLVWSSKARVSDMSLFVQSVEVILLLIMVRILLETTPTSTSFDTEPSKCVHLMSSALLIRATEETWDAVLHMMPRMTTTGRQCQWRVQGMRQWTDALRDGMDWGTAFATTDPSTTSSSVLLWWSPRCLLKMDIIPSSLTTGCMKIPSLVITTNLSLTVPRNDLFALLACFTHSHFLQADPTVVRNLNLLGWSATVTSPTTSSNDCSHNLSILSNSLELE